MSLIREFRRWQIDEEGNFTYIFTQKDLNQRTTKSGFVAGIATELQQAGFIKSTGVFAQVKVKEINSNYTVVKGDNLLLVDASGGNIIISLPLAVNFWDDALDLSDVIEIKRQDTNPGNTVTILPTIPELIDGDPSLILDTATTPSARVFTNGTNFFTTGT